MPTIYIVVIDEIQDLIHAISHFSISEVLHKKLKLLHNYAIIISQLVLKSDFMLKTLRLCNNFLKTCNKFGLLK
jgi:hypothetical protein